MFGPLGEEELIRVKRQELSEDHGLDAPGNLLNRREALKRGGAALLASLPLRASGQTESRRPKKVIVGGGGIAGLSCAYELKKLGHDVTLLEASGRAGGHVRTLHDPFPDGLYADAGAEHCYFPGYTLYQQLVHELDLPLISYPRRHNMVRVIQGKLYREEDLHSRSILGGLGLNQREITYLADHPWWEIPLIYVQSYVDQVKKEDTPFGWGLDELDRMSLTDLLKREGASSPVLSGDVYGGNSGSALEYIWNAAMKQLRGAPLLSRDLFRIQGGNQCLTDAFAKQLRERIQLWCAVEGIRQGAAGVTVTYRRAGQRLDSEADYLVCCMSAIMLRQISVSPPWPEEKNYIIRNLPYYTLARVIFQSRTKFWEKDRVSPNMEFNDPSLTDCWQMAEDVSTPRGILIGSAPASSSAETALAAFRKYYPGKSEDIEQVTLWNWATHPWAMGCERINYPPGELAKFWPKVTEPCNRVHFAGAYAANMSWGQEAALESAHRAAQAIHAA